MSDTALRLEEAAAEMRRLHDLVTEDSILLRRQRDEIAQLKALNAELVEALRAMLYDDDQDEATCKARAALAKVEDSK